MNIDVVTKFLNTRLEDFDEVKYFFKVQINTSIN